MPLCKRTLRKLRKERRNQECVQNARCFELESRMFEIVEMMLLEPHGTGGGRRVRCHGSEHWGLRGA